MRKLENFSNCLKELKSADFEMAGKDNIYRMGIIGQFNLAFELAWKALQAVLRIHGVQNAETGSPREILQLGYRMGFIDDADVWLLMLKKRNISIHIYDEDEVSETLILIKERFIPTFNKLETTLSEKIKETENDWK